MCLQYVEKTPAPVYDNPEDVPRWFDSTSDIGAGPYQYMPPQGEEGQNSHALEGATLHSDSHGKMSEKPGSSRNSVSRTCS